MRFLIFIVSVLVLASCGSSPQRPDAILSQDRIEAANSAVESVQPATANAPQANTSGLPHYYCPNNCAGSGGDAAGSCPTCGTAYVHNDAFHNQTQTPNPVTTTQPLTVNGDGTAVPNPEASLPAQNAKGVYHYTCPNGCAGGAAGAGSCSGCGGALAHNSAYHDN